MSKALLAKALLEIAIRDASGVHGRGDSEAGNPALMSTFYGAICKACEIKDKSGCLFRGSRSVVGTSRKRSLMAKQLQKDAPEAAG